MGVARPFGVLGVSPSSLEGELPAGTLLRASLDGLVVTGVVVVSFGPSIIVVPAGWVPFAVVTGVSVAPIASMVIVPIDWIPITVAVGIVAASSEPRERSIT